MVVGELYFIVSLISLLAFSFDFQDYDTFGDGDSACYYLCHRRCNPQLLF